MRAARRSSIDTATRNQRDRRLGDTRRLPWPAIVLAGGALLSLAANLAQAQPRRAELLAEIRKAQDKRAEARRDWAEDVIDKEDWLDIKQRTDDRINRARKEYDRLTGTATVFGDIPPSDAVRDAWQQWNTDRRRAAVKAVLNGVTVSPDIPGRRGTRNRALRVDAVRQRTEFHWRF